MNQTRIQRPAAPAGPPANSWLVVALLWLFFPVGLGLMWSRTRWRIELKVLISAAIGLPLLCGLISAIIHPEPQRGTSPDKSPSFRLRTPATPHPKRSVFRVMKTTHTLKGTHAIRSRPESTHPSREQVTADSGYLRSLNPVINRLHTGSQSYIAAIDAAQGGDAFGALSKMNQALSVFEDAEAMLDELSPPERCRSTHLSFRADIALAVSGVRKIRDGDLTGSAQEVKRGGKLYDRSVDGFDYVLLEIADVKVRDGTLRLSP